MAKRNLFIDLETTGLEPEEGAAIVSIGAIVPFRLKRRNEDVEFYGVVKLTKKEWDRAHPKALEVNGFTWEQVQEEGEPFQKVLDSFILWLADLNITRGKAQVLGQNPKFDMKFLRFYFGVALDFINFPWDHVVDIRELYSSLANQGTTKVLKYRSGENISKALEVEPEGYPHNALAGAQAVMRNYDKMVEMGVYE